jgi:hypothetical protein
MSVRNVQLEDSGRVLSSQTVPPTTGTGKGAFYTKTVGGITEAYFVDSNGSEVQLTNAGAISVPPTSGEANTASNLGAGTQLFAGKVGVDLTFKTLVQGAGMILSNNADTVTLTASVVSVNGATGIITLDADDIDDSSTTNKFTTASDIAKLAGIEAGAQVNPTQVDAGEKTAGTETALRSFSPADVAEMAGTHGGGSVANLSDIGDVPVYPNDGNTNVLKELNGSLAWGTESGGGSAATVAADITIPTGASLSARLAAATGLPAGWSLVLGNDGSVSADFSLIGPTATDIVLIHNEGKPVGSFRVMRVLSGTSAQQQGTFDPSAGDTFEDGSFNQLFLRSFEDAAKGSTSEARLVVIIPA